MDQIVTEQLNLRPPTSADENAYLALFMRPEVGEWLRPTPLPPLAPGDVVAMLGDDVRHWEDFGFGPWALTERDGGRYVGRAGLRWTTVEGESVVELAWTVDPGQQGRGLATEAALAGVAAAPSLEIERLIALCLPHNVASRRVAEKAGMSENGKVLHAGLDHVLYRLTLA